MRTTHTALSLTFVLLIAGLGACGERGDESATSLATAQSAPGDAGTPAQPAGERAAAAPADSVAATAPAAADESAAAPAAEHSASIEFEIYKAGFIVGVSGGRGTLHFQGKSYPVSIGGVSVGATAGVSKADLVGEARNLHSLQDIEGTYSATQAGLAIGGGDKITKLKNSRGVELDVRGKQMGIELSLDLNGMEIWLAK